MTSTRLAAKALALVLPCCLLAPAQASEPALLTITATPGKAVCAANAATAGQNTTPSKICVLAGSFGHDMYLLEMDGKPVVHGIDDQTTSGVSAIYKGQAVNLRCEPQDINPKGTPEATLAEVQRVMPNATPDEAKSIAELIGTGPMGIEIGRLCTAGVDGKAFMKVQVLFK